MLVGANLNAAAVRDSAQTDPLYTNRGAFNATIPHDLGNSLRGRDRRPLPKIQRTCADHGTATHLRRAACHELWGTSGLKTDAQINKVVLRLHNRTNGIWLVWNLTAITNTGHNPGAPLLDSVYKRLLGEHSVYGRVILRG